MFEYAAVTGGIREWWMEQMASFGETFRASAYFWPGVLAAALLFILEARQVTK